MLYKRFLTYSIFVFELANYCIAAVQVNGRTLLVDGEPFLMRGVAYNPIPIGLTPDVKHDYYTNSASNIAIWQRDIAILKNMGCNTIRLYGWDNSLDHTQFLDVLLENGIRVVLQYWFPSSNDISNSATRTQLINGFTSMVNNYKYHPAIIMWLFGNELNAPWNYQSKLIDLFSLLDAAATAAHEAEGINYRPVSSPFADINLYDQIRQYQHPQIDVWTVQVYRGKTFGDLFQYFTNNVATKPMFITEFGIDAYDNSKQTENQVVHSEYVTSLWNEIVANTGACSGGCVFAYCDEWWKGRDASQPSGCPDLDPSTHSNCGASSGSFPDAFANEEWFGLHAITKASNANEPDILTPRTAASALSQLWRVTVPLAPVADATPLSVVPTSNIPTSFTPSSVRSPGVQDSLLSPTTRSSLSDGAIAGIAIGAAIGAVGIVLFVIYLIPQARLRAYPWTSRSTTVAVGNVLQTNA